MRIPSSVFSQNQHRRVRESDPPHMPLVFRVQHQPSRLQEPVGGTQEVKRQNWRTPMTAATARMPTGQGGPGEGPGLFGLRSPPSSLIIPPPSSLVFDCEVRCPTGWPAQEASGAVVSSSRTLFTLSHSRSTCTHSKRVRSLPRPRRMQSSWPSCCNAWNASPGH